MQLVTQELMDFSDTKIAFRNRTDKDVRKIYRMYRMMNNRSLVSIGNTLARCAVNLHLPINGIIRDTIYWQFCGGETIDKCQPVIDKLEQNGVNTILDYSVEGGKENDFDHTTEEIIRILHYAQKHKAISYSCMKMNGLARHELMKKINNGDSLNPSEQSEFDRVKNRVERICQAAYDTDVPVYIDAEETWIQKPIDKLCLELMRAFNKKKAVLSGTMQMYVRDNLDYLKNLHDIAGTENFVLGVKFVRGAYLEKERMVAQTENRPSPVWDTKEECDRSYDQAVKYALDNIDKICVCNATHNEKSTQLMVSTMEKKGIPKKHPHCWFSQLYGMSNHITNHLGYAGYNVTKYLPYGPIKQVLPYLLRRAEENSGIAGQMGRELMLVTKEKNRRGL